MSESIQKTLTVTNDVYSVADVVGGLITFDLKARARGRSYLIPSVKLGGVSALAYDLWFLSADIATPAADNAAFTIVAADEAKVLGIVPITAADYYAAQSSFNVACLSQVGLLVQLPAGATSVYAYLVAKATTSPGTTKLYLTVDFIPAD